MARARYTRSLIHAQSANLEKASTYFGVIADYYSPDMAGLKTDQEVLGELVKVKAPAVGQLMDQYPGIWTLVASRWFICLYIDILPIEVSRGAPSTTKLRCAITRPALLSLSCAPPCLLPHSADGPASLGLSVLRGLQGSFPCGPDPHHAPSAGDPEGSLAARRLPVLQADHLWRFHPGLSHLYAGTTMSACGSTNKC